MRFLSLGLLTPVQHDHDLNISPSFCPSFVANSTQAELYRRYEIYLLVKGVIGDQGYVVYQHYGSGNYYSIG
jgi:20S proteasome alpha/beta subunit